MKLIITEKSVLGARSGDPADLCMYCDCCGRNNIMLQSNFLCDNRIFAYFGPQLDEHNFNHAGVVLFQCHLHRCKTSSMN